MGPASDYVGSELVLFAGAKRWKAYWGGQLAPYLSGSVLEVGTGLGENTRLLCRGSGAPWVCLEPDGAMSRRLRKDLDEGRLPARCEVVRGTVFDLPPDRRFDTVFYADVLEHIEDDRADMARAAALVNRGGHVAVIAPAFRALASEFDRAVGHFRRYDRASLLAVAPPDLHPVKVRYRDSFGLATSFANRFFLRQGLPTASQIAFWDRFLVPASRAVDLVTLHRAGRSILAVWRRL